MAPAIGQLFHRARTDTADDGQSRGGGIADLEKGIGKAGRTNPENLLFLCHSLTGNGVQIIIRCGIEDVSTTFPAGFRYLCMDRRIQTGGEQVGKLVCFQGIARVTGNLRFHQRNAVNIETAVLYSPPLCRQ